MDIFLNPIKKPEVRYKDLNYGDVFLSFCRMSNLKRPHVYMKVKIWTPRGDGQDGVLNLEDGEFFSDVENYLVDEVVDNTFSIDYKPLDT